MTRLLTILTIAISWSIHAQGIYGIVQEEVCWTVGNDSTNLTRHRMISQQDQPGVILAYTDAAGDTITPAGGTLRLGWCSDSTIRTQPEFLNDIAPAGLSNVYSLRLVDNTYTGPLVQVRRSSDNALYSIPYVLPSATLDLDSLRSFCNGSDSCTISAWYDQVSGQHVSSMGVVSREPVIYESGDVLTHDGRIAVRFDSTDILRRTSGWNTQNNLASWAVFWVSSSTSENTAQVVWSTKRTDVIPASPYAGFEGYSPRYTTAVNAEVGVASTLIGSSRFVRINPPPSDSSNVLFSFLSWNAPASTYSCWVNGIPGTGGAIGGSSSGTNNTFAIGAGRAVTGGYYRPMKGYIYEIIGYTSDKRTERIDIEEYINDYYNI